jgi:hypothetical protein
MTSNKRFFDNDETFILIDICWCGHDRTSHCGLNRCNEKDCNCLGFSP